MQASHSIHFFGPSAAAIAAAILLTACGPGDGAAQAAAPTLPPGYVAVPAADAARLGLKPAAPVRLGAQGAAQVAPAPKARPVVLAGVGEVRAIEPIRTRPAGTGVGAVVGGVLGGVLGNQIGKGDGRTAATAIGALGGAVAGNNVERNQNEGVSGYRVRVALDNGSTQTFEEGSVKGLHVGDRVQLENGHIRRL